MELRLGMRGATSEEVALSGTGCGLAGAAWRVNAETELFPDSSTFGRSDLDLFENAAN
jgi:hypothetical protein